MWVGEQVETGPTNTYGDDRPDTPVDVSAEYAREQPHSGLCPRTAL
jgi:hypothetical protein